MPYRFLCFRERKHNLSKGSSICGTYLAKTRTHMKYLILIRPLSLLLATFLFPLLSAQAQNAFCVRAGATGANNGSDWNNAFSSLPATLQRGAIYYVADGSYGSYVFHAPVSGSE